MFEIDVDARIDFVKYRENHLFRATTAEGSAYTVRLHRQGYHGDAEVRTEMMYLRALRAEGVPVPDVRATADGGVATMS